MERTISLLISTLVLLVAPHVNAQFNFTRTTCEMSKVCVTDPNNCDPAGNSTCLFGSLKVTSQNPPNGFNLYNELSGMSSGYIALGLKPGQGNTTLYICGRNDTNNETFFSTMLLSGENNTLTKLSTSMAMFPGNMTAGKIQCVFNVTNLNATTSTRSSQDSTFTVVIGNGSVTDGVIGNFMKLSSRGPLDLNNPANTTANTTTVPTTTMSAATSVMPYHAVLVLLGILGMTVLGTA
ncbi:putative ferric-chelate reductase 1 [Oryzias latipes]|uniref:putative ferric-chelate reductase 1 n=1 Tax=Oryzias latipes TaxID=8090 RepID=UPI0002A483DD|nr:putative ferric-chelate reductase 1 [Oryzias latipes]